MTSKDRIDRDISEVSETVLGRLSPAERVRLFATAAAANNDEWIEMIWATAPRNRYEMADLESKSGARTVFILSILANGELVRLETELRAHEAERDRNVALVLLSEALSRLSGGRFSVDEFGATEIPPSWPDAYGPRYDPETSKLATKFRDLWNGTSLEFAVPEPDRSRPYFPELAASALVGYRTDLSDEVFDDLQPFVHSAVYQSEVKLVRTAVEYYRSFHAWRIFAEEHLEISLDEFLAVTQGPDELGGPFPTLDGAQLDHQHCEWTVSRYQPYLDAYADVVEALCDHTGKPFEGVPDLDEQAAEYAAELAACIELPL